MDGFKGWALIMSYPKPDKPEEKKNFYHESTEFKKHEKEHFLFRAFVFSSFRDCY